MSQETLILDVKTINANAIKYVFQLLCKILPEANIRFEKDKMRIFTTDQSKTVLIQLCLEAKGFETYEVLENITCGVNLTNLSDTLSIIENGSTLQFSVSDSNRCQLGIIIHNEDENITIKRTIDLLEIDDLEVRIPQVTFNTVIQMRTNKFQKIVRELAGHDEKYIEIIKVEKTLRFKSKNNSGTTEILVGESENNISFDTNNVVEMIQGVFSAKTLLCFTKGTNLHNNMQIFIKNDFPLIIRYMVGDLGYLKLALAPIKQEQI